MYSEIFRYLDNFFPPEITNKIMLMGIRTPDANIIKGEIKDYQKYLADAVNIKEGAHVKEDVHIMSFIDFCLFYKKSNRYWGFIYLK